MNSIRSFQFALAALSLAAIAACGGDANAPPTIIAQPANVTVAGGGSASFNVSATGTDPLSYAWLNAADSSVIPGASSATLAAMRSRWPTPARPSRCASATLAAR